MAFTGYEVPITLPPLRRVRYSSLLGSIQELVVQPLRNGPNGFTDTNTRRWQFGVKFVPRDCKPLRTLGADCAPVNKIVDLYEDVTTQPAFTLYDGLQCSILSNNPAEMAQQLTNNLDVLASAIFANELVSGLASGGNSLSSTAAVPLGGLNSLPISAALNFLEDELGVRLQGAVGMIHVTPGVLGALVRNGSVRIEGDSYTSPSGHTVVGDAGYVTPGIGMLPPVGQPLAVDGQEWMYASGPVLYKQSPIDELGEDIEQMDWARNTLLKLQEKYGILVFEPCPVIAVLACFEVCGCGPEV